MHFRPAVRRVLQPRRIVVRFVGKLLRPAALTTPEIACSSAESSEASVSDFASCVVISGAMPSVASRRRACRDLAAAGRFRLLWQRRLRLEQRIHAAVGAGMGILERFALSTALAAASATFFGSCSRATIFASSAQRSTTSWALASSRANSSISGPVPTSSISRTSIRPSAIDLIDHFLGDAFNALERLIQPLHAILEFGRREDVDVPAGQSRRQAHVLPALADRQRKLIFIDDNGRAAQFEAQAKLPQLPPVLAHY